MNRLPTVRHTARSERGVALSSGRIRPDITVLPRRDDPFDGSKAEIRIQDGSESAEGTGRLPFARAGNDPREAASSSGEKPAVRQTAQSKVPTRMS